MSCFKVVVGDEVLLVSIVSEFSDDEARARDFLLE